MAAPSTTTTTAAGSVDERPALDKSASDEAAQMALAPTAGDGSTVARSECSANCSGSWSGSEGSVRRRIWNAIRLLAERTRRWESNLFRDVDASSLAVFRISFGILMLLDIPHERGFSMADVKWGNEEMCHFPLIHVMAPLPYEWMCLVYSVMCIGALGITLGYRFRLSCVSFCATYWYVVLLDKSSWNNHTYLYGLLAVLLCTTEANAAWSIDRTRGATVRDGAPFWNYSVLRFQIFVLYFMAGVKKIDLDWLSGHSMKNLSRHWVFNPFRLCLTGQQVDLWIVHVSGFLIDLFAGFGLQFHKTRPLTFAFLFAFHFMNSRMFQIGVFPYVGMASMLVFCEHDWPRTLLDRMRSWSLLDGSEDGRGGGWKRTCARPPPAVSRRQRFALHALVAVYVFVQLFLPFSHFITKGYNNGWTNGLYGYSWDMMVHSWDNSMSVIKVVEKANGKEHYLSAQDWAMNQKWMKHPDMVVQFARCARRNLRRRMGDVGDISIHVDFWFSLNGRFHQRMFDPRVDLLTAQWSPFRPVPWLMPLLVDLSDWRATLQRLRDETDGQADADADATTELIFIADFPGLSLENYVNEELSNVSLTLLKGRIQLEDENGSKGVALNAGDRMQIRAGTFHRIRTISSTPSCYMYSYHNTTRGRSTPTSAPSPVAQLRQEIETRLADMRRSLQLASDALHTIVCKRALRSFKNTLLGLA